VKIFATTPEDNKRNVMRLELDGADVELLEELVDRVERLVKVEEALDVVGIQSVGMFGQDLPTVSAEGAKFLKRIVDGWDADEDIEEVTHDV
jgi:hypothetical protein